MRNLVQYPVNKDEIIRCLTGLYMERERLKLCGDMEPLLLQQAIEHVRASTLGTNECGLVGEANNGPQSKA